VEEKDRDEILNLMLTPQGKAFAEALVSGTQAGEVSKFKRLMSYSPEDEVVIENLELLLIVDDFDRAVVYGEVNAKKLEEKGKYWEAAKIYEMINEISARFRVLREGMIYYESIGNFGYAAGFAELLGDFDRANAYNHLHEIQLKLEFEKEFRE